MLARFRGAFSKWSVESSKFLRDTTNEFMKNERNRITKKQLEMMDKTNKYSQSVKRGFEQYKASLSDGFKVYKSKIQGDIYMGVDGVRRSAVDNAKRAIKNSPLYVYKLVWLFGKYSAYVGYKFLTKTRSGKAISMGLGTVFVGRVGYVYGTRFERDIELVKSFNRLGENESDGVNEYMISDEKSRIYTVRNSTWYGQWWSTELWTSLIPGKMYHITGYGIRIAAFGIYPRVIYADLVDDSNENRSTIKKMLSRRGLEK